jgi:catechol 2,3-dioxygenase-like lactoylglutathione lyase family enzyme
MPAAAPILQLHHYAYRARDAEQTRHFYEDILGLPLANQVGDAQVLQDCLRAAQLPPA